MQAGQKLTVRDQERGGTAKRRRRLTVSRLYRERERRPWEREVREAEPVPYLRMQGRWLAEAGFGIGQKIAVDVRDGELVVRRAAGAAGRE
jgi:hypothetical protein